MKLPFLKQIKKTEMSEEIVSEEPIRISDLIAPSFVEAKQNYLKLGEQLVKSYFVFS